MKEFKGPNNVVYLFDTHGRNGPYDTRIAVNVKHYGSLAPLDEEHEAMLARLAIEFGEKISTTREKLAQQAWEQAQERWWRWAHDEAIQRGLGIIQSAGRSGGWLVLDDWTPSRVDDLLEYEEVVCRNCSAHEDEHSGDKCLFAATTFESMIVLAEDSRKVLDNLAEYVDLIEKSLDEVGGDLTEEFRYLIRYNYDEHFPPSPQLEMFDLSGAPLVLRS